MHLQGWGRCLGCENVWLPVGRANHPWCCRVGLRVVYMNDEPCVAWDDNGAYRSSLPKIPWVNHGLTWFGRVIEVVTPMVCMRFCEPSLFIPSQSSAVGMANHQTRPMSTRLVWSRGLRHPLRTSLSGVPLNVRSRWVHAQNMQAKKQVVTPVHRRTSPRETTRPHQPCDRYFSLKYDEHKWRAAWRCIPYSQDSLSLAK